MSRLTRSERYQKQDITTMQKAFLLEMTEVMHEIETLKSEAQMIESCLGQSFTLEDWLDFKNASLASQIKRKQALIDAQVNLWAKKGVVSK